MPQPRHTQIDIDATPFYHCISRCVRRAFLCGTDTDTGKSFDHRKGWLVELLGELADVFAVDLCAYSILSNHYHLVVRLDGERARSWTSEEVVRRYVRLFPSTVEARLAQPASEVNEWIGRWRARLYDLSWFMRCLNEAVARRANAEDHCTGRFWEGRFRSQALLDEAGLLTCMAYVDLNPIRAGLADCLEGCDFTSIQQRLGVTAPAPDSGGRTEPVEQLPAADADPEAEPAAVDPSVRAVDVPKAAGLHSLPGRGGLPELWPFADAPDRGVARLPMDRLSYIELLAATGGLLRAGPNVRLPETIARQLETVGVNSEQWLPSIREYRCRFFAMVGSVHSIDVYCARTDRDHAKGRAWAARAFRTAA